MRRLIMIDDVPRRGRPKGTPNGRKGLKNIVSLRVSDDEKESLEKLAEDSGTSVSHMLRAALVNWVKEQRALEESR